MGGRCFSYFASPVYSLNCELSSDLLAKNCITIFAVDGLSVVSLLPHFDICGSVKCVASAKSLGFNPNCFNSSLTKVDLMPPCYR